MHAIRIKNIDDAYFEEFLSVYSTSFPIFEQRTKKQHVYAFEQTNCFVKCYFEKDTFIGFIIYWEFQHFIYIEHLAIHPELRGKNYGSLLLSQFIENKEKKIILEIDPLNDEISLKRYNFYKHLGFIKNDHNHTHPAYREEFKDHQLILLSTQRVLNKEEYKLFYTELKSVVMNKDSN